MKSPKSRSKWAWVHLSRFAPSVLKSIRFTRNPTKYRNRRRPLLNARAAKVVRYWPWEPRWSVRLKMRPRRMRDGRDRHAGKAEAGIFLYPGKPFRIVNQLLTNFHLPQSSLLALVAAFAGREHILDAYRHAVDQGYRFYSYGDCDADPLNWMAFRNAQRCIVQASAVRLL